MPQRQVYDSRPYDDQRADETDHDGKPSPHAHNFSKENCCPHCCEQRRKKAERSLLADGDKGDCVKPHPHGDDSGNGAEDVGLELSRGDLADA